MRRDGMNEHSLRHTLVQRREILCSIWTKTTRWTNLKLQGTYPSNLDQSQLKLYPPLPQTPMYFLRTYSMLPLVCCCIHLRARFKRVTRRASSPDTFYRFRGWNPSSFVLFVMAACQFILYVLYISHLFHLVPRITFPHFWISRINVYSAH